MTVTQNALMLDLIECARTALDLLDLCEICVLEIRLEGSRPLIIIEDPDGKLTDATPVTRTSSGGGRTSVNTQTFAGARLQWRSRQ